MNSRKELKPGDRVRLVKPYTIEGVELRDRRFTQLGAEGAVSIAYYGDNGASEGQVVITWDDGGYEPHQIKKMSNGHWVDVSCLENLSTVSEVEVEAAIESIKEAL